MPLHSLDLVPDEPGRAQVRELWERLRAAGLPSQADHRGASNQPHVTVVEAEELPDDAVDVARARLRGLLPTTVRATGHLLLGAGSRTTLAVPVELDDDVVRRVLAVRVQVPERSRTAWLPHLTLARGLPRADVPHALEVLGAVDLTLTLEGVRRWDPDRGHVTTL